MKNARWACVLAGGDGRRLESFLSNIYEDKRPKQYCTLHGTHSMLEQTLDRAHALVPPEHVVLSLQRAHQRWFRSLRGTSLAHHSIQPSNAGTGAGILLALMWIAQHDPSATVVMLPSDHYIADEQRFVDYVEETADWVEDNPNAIVIMGVKAEYPEQEYGWLLPRSSHESSESPCPAQLLEKPSAMVAQELFQKGACWNTMVQVYRCDTMMRVFRKQAPEWHDALSRAILLGPYAIEEVYNALPVLDFSRDIMQACRDQIYLKQMHNIGWSDWGSVSRIRRSVPRVPSMQATVKTFLQEAS